MYLFFFDEAKKYLKNNPKSLSQFKEMTGNIQNFPGNIFIYATSNHNISEFDPSLYRTGRLFFQQWGYLTKQDIINDNLNIRLTKKWNNVLDANVNIRYVDYKVKGESFLNSIITETQSLYDKGVNLPDYKETETNNRMNMSKYKIFSKWKLKQILNLPSLEKLALRYKIVNKQNKNRAWFMYERDIGNINVFELPFYVFIVK